MRSGADRLRAGLLAGAVAVLAVVAVFLVAARWRSRHLLRDLPGRLGAEIQKETNGFTYSQSLGGRTVFTIHAARATQRKDGQALLHDVGIVLYGKDGRTDRIRGKDFDYDQAAGVVRAEGEVELDLQAPAPATARERAAFAAGQEIAPGKDAGGQPVHVVTSGLVYVQKLGVASTGEPIRFSVRGVTGQAVGASFNTDTGRMVLEHAVRVSTLVQGRPALLTAAHAELDRSNHAMRMNGARYVTFGGGRESDERVLEAGELFLHLREDGSVERADGDGGVEMKAGGLEVRAPHGTMEVAADGRPQQIHMGEGVRFKNAEPDGEGNAGQGAAEQADARLNEGGGLTEVHLRGKARMELQGRETQRELQADDVLLRFTGERRALLRSAEATGNAVLTETAEGRYQDVSGSRLMATFREGAGGRAVPAMLTGDGGVTVHRRVDGTEETSRSRSLEATFGPEGGRAAGTKKGRSGVVAAVQRGDVTIERRGPGRDGRSEDMRARGEEARFDGVTRRETLRGGVQVSDATGTTRADEVTFDEGTQRAEAVGAVQVSYLGTPAQEGAARSSKAPEVTHVAADRANFDRARQQAEFYGRTGGPVRLWQGGSAVEAPVLLLDQVRGTLEAKGSGADGAGVVHSTFETEGSKKPEPLKGGTRTGPEIVQVASSRLRYDSTARQATFTGGVVLQAGENEIESTTAVATLLPTATQADAKRPAAGFAAGGLERVVATGDVSVRQPPGRVGTGSQAVYTAETGEVVLTGTAAKPPRVRDPQQGELTGGQIRFHVGDNRFVVDGTKTDETSRQAGRVHSRVREPEGGR